jgi:hypothetical protein
MTETILVFDPTARPRGKSQFTTRTIADLSGITVGFIDNSKPNFEFLVDELSELLLSRYGVAKIIKRRKRVAGIPASQPIMDEMAQHCDLIITGSGD